MAAPRKRVFITSHAAQAARGDVAKAIKAGPGRRPGTIRRAAEGFDWPVLPAGSVGPVTIWAAQDLGDTGTQVAANVTGRIADACIKLTGWFGNIECPKVNVIIAPLSDSHDGTGGAYWYGGSGRDIYVDACDVDDGERTTALFVAEMSEVLATIQNLGWDAGKSNGESLSRLHAELAFPVALDDYASFPDWLQSKRPNWIDDTADTDVDWLSYGCGVGFLFWLLDVHGQTVEAVTQAGGKTLAETAGKLLPDLHAWDDFATECESRWPSSGAKWPDADEAWHEPPSPPDPPDPPDPTAELSAVVTIPEGTAPGEYTLALSGGADPIPPGIYKGVCALMQMGVDPNVLQAIIDEMASLFVGAGLKHGQAAGKAKGDRKEK